MAMVGEEWGSWAPVGVVPNDLGGGGPLCPFDCLADNCPAPLPMKVPLMDMKMGKPIEMQGI